MNNLAKNKIQFNRLGLFALIIVVVVLYVVSKRAEFESSTAKLKTPNSPKAATEITTMGSSPAEPSSVDNYFIEQRLEIQRSRSQQTELLQKIIQNASSDETARRDAAGALIELTKNIEKEKQIEGILKAKGYEEVLVMIRDQGASVVIRATELTPQDVAIIGDSVSRYASIPPENISIIAR